MPDKEPARTPWVRASIFLAIGSLAGLVAGAFGGGGGIIAVPALVLLMKLPYKQAVGISSGMVAGSALAGAASYARWGFGLAYLPPTAIGYVDLLAAGLIAPTGMIGAIIGAKLTTRIDVLLMKRLFAAILLLIGLRMVL